MIRTLCFCNISHTFEKYCKYLAALVFLQTLTVHAAGDENYFSVYVVRSSDRDYQRVSHLRVDRKTLSVLQRTDTAMGCDRVHAEPNGHLLCFTRIIPHQPKHYGHPTAYIWADAYSSAIPQKLYQIKGRVSRARLSADGEFVGTTVFTTGHSYLGVGGSSFSTTAQIGRSRLPSAPEDLQNWTVYQESGAQVRAIDLNLWGVSFNPRQSSKFLVTVYYNSTPYLGEGDVQSRTIRALIKDVECPSYSPDGQKIAYKKRISATQWAPAVMDLATKKSVVYLRVTKSVDDQIEWLDANTLVFEVTDAPLLGMPRTDLVTLDVRDPSNQERLWLEDAKSPAPLRPPPR